MIGFGRQSWRFFFVRPQKEREAAPTSSASASRPLCLHSLRSTFYYILRRESLDWPPRRVYLLRINCPSCIATKLILDIYTTNKIVGYDV